MVDFSKDPIWIKFKADIKDLSTSVDKAKRHVKGYHDSTNTEMKKVADVWEKHGRTIKLAAAVVVAQIGVIGAALGKVTKDYIAYGVQIDKMVKQTGIAAETMSGLKYAADQEHTSIEILTKGIQNLARMMVYAQRGNNDYSRAFSEMGVNVTNAAGRLRDVEDVFFEIADYMKAATNQTEAMANAQVVLGRAGKDAVPFFKLGSDAIKDYIKQAEDLGITITTLEAKRLKALDDRMLEIKMSFKGLGFDIAETFIPILEDKLIPALSKTTEFMRSLAAAFLNNEQELNNLREQYKELKTTGDIFQRQQILITEQQLKDAKAKLENSTITDKLSNEYQKLEDNVSSLRGELIAQYRIFLAMNPEIKKTPPAIDKTTQSLQTEGVKLDFTTGLWQKYWETKTNWRGTKEMNLGAGIFDTDSTKRATQDQDAHVREYYKSQQRWNRQFWMGFNRDTESGLAKTNEFWYQFGEEANMLAEDFGYSLSNSMADAMTTMAFEGGKAIEIFEEFINALKKAVINMISSIAAKLAASQILKGLGALFSAAGLPGIGTTLNIAGEAVLEKGGFAWKGGGSLPDVPKAQFGMITPSNTPKTGMLALLHGDEVVLPIKYLNELFGKMAERFFGGYGLPAPVYNQQRTNTVNLYVSADPINDKTTWRRLYRDCIRPAMEEDNYRRV